MKVFLLLIFVSQMGCATHQIEAPSTKTFDNLVKKGTFVKMGPIKTNVFRPKNMQLKVTMVFEVDNPEVAEEIKARTIQIHDLSIAIIQNQKISTDLSIARETLRESIKDTFNKHLLLNGKIEHVYFFEFLISTSG